MSELLFGEGELSADSKALLDAFRALMEDPDSCRRMALGLKPPRLETQHVNDDHG